MPTRNDPSTSKDAFRSLDPAQIRDIYVQINLALCQIGSGTFEDIAYALKLPKERIWRRLKEMEDQKYIYRDGTKKRLSSGRQGMVWRVMPAHGTTEKVTEKALPGPSVGDYSKKLIQGSLL